MVASVLLDASIDAWTQTPAQVPKEGDSLLQKAEKCWVCMEDIAVLRCFVCVANFCYGCDHNVHQDDLRHHNRAVLRDPKMLPKAVPPTRDKLHADLRSSVTAPA